MNIFLMFEHFLAHLVYHPESLNQSCFVRCTSSVLLAWLASDTSLLATGSNIEISYLVQLCTYVPDIKY